MKRNIRYVIAFTIILGILVGLSVCRRVMIDKAVLALKEENYSIALRYFKPLAVIGDTEAQREIGFMYAYGWGVNKDDTVAVRWFNRAGNRAKHEYSVAERYRTLFDNQYGNVRENSAEAIKWYERAAEGHYQQAAEFLGKAYSDGLLGLVPDSKKSQYWSEIARKINDAARK